MKRFVPVSIVAALIVAGVVLSLTVGGGGGSQVQGPAHHLYAEVWEALETANEVDVYVALRRRHKPGEPITEEESARTARLQDAVLSVLTPEDFTLNIRYRFAPALAMRINESGLSKLEGHPDVVGIEIIVSDPILDRPGT